MDHVGDHYIAGKWVKSLSDHSLEVINPETEKPVAAVAVGTAADIDLAVRSASRAFTDWSSEELITRVELIKQFAAIDERRSEEMAQRITQEMGAPIDFSRAEQASSTAYCISTYLAALKNFEFIEQIEDSETISKIEKVPIGVCGLITPWNWPMSQVSLKVVAAILVGCTVVLKPSERSPLSSLLFAEMIDEAGFPPGVFNLVTGDGITTGAALAAHPSINMMSFTGSTRGGVAVSAAAADTTKRVSLELGGKSPNILFADVDLSTAVPQQMEMIFNNSGQNCNAPSRLLVERSVYDQVVALASAIANEKEVDLPTKEGDHIGPLSSKMQFDKVQAMIAAGIEEGARLTAGGLGRPDNFERGYFVRPTVFADVKNDMRIAREEIFGPVLCILPFDTEEEAIEIANDTQYGLSGYVQSKDFVRAERVARALRVGMVQINGANQTFGSPFGGVKLSGMAREGGKWGLEEYLISQCNSFPKT